MDSFEDLGFGDWKPPVERGSVVTHFERFPVIVHRHQRSPKPLRLPLVLRFNALPDVKNPSEVAVAASPPTRWRLGLLMTACVASGRLQAA